MIRACVALVFSLALSATASAAPFTWVLQGNITSLTSRVSDGPYDGLLVVGNPFTVTVTMESSVPDLDPNPHCGLYQPITSTALQTGGLLATGFGGIVSIASRDLTGSDSCRIDVGLGRNFGRIQSGFSGGLVFDFFYSQLLLTDSLPTDPTGLTSLSFGLFAGSSMFPLAGGRVTSVVAVPEPVESTLLLVALASVAARRRRSRMVAAPR